MYQIIDVPNYLKFKAENRIVDMEMNLLELLFLLILRLI